MDRKIGIYERYPKASNRTLILLVAYPAIVFTGNVFGFYGYERFWGISPGGVFFLATIFAGMYWLGELFTVVTNSLYRVGYNAAMDDVVITVAGLCAEMYVAGPMDPNEFDKRSGAAFLRLRPEFARAAESN